MEVFIPNFYIYPNLNILFECTPILISLSTHNSKICVPKVTKSFSFCGCFFFFFFFFVVVVVVVFVFLFLFSKRFITKKSKQGNRIGVAPFLQGGT